METPAKLPLTGERTVAGDDRENYWFRRHEVVYEWIVKSFNLSGKTVADAGCGEGYGAGLLATVAGSVQAWDYDEATINHVAAKYPALKAVHGNLSEFPSADGSIDGLVSLQVIEHIWDIKQFLSEVLRVLPEGGLTILSTPNRLTFSPGLGRREKPTNPFHVEEFDGDQLVELMRDAGFIDVLVHGVFEGPRLRQLAAGKGDLVQRQVTAILSDDWPADLDIDVTATTTADFELRPEFEGALDLVVVAGRPAHD